MDAYVINLDRSKDRWLLFEARNARLMARLQRFAAVDGQTVDRRALVERGVIAADADAGYTPGALGNLLSHLALWNRAIELQRPITVCEDDAIFNHNFFTVLELLRLPADWHFVAWGWNFDSIVTFDLIPGVSPCVARFDQAMARRGIAAFQSAAVKPALFRLFEFFGMVCYSISPAGAWLLRDLCLPVRKMGVPIAGLGCVLPNTDWGVLVNLYLRRINAYVGFPPLVFTRNDHANSTVLPR